MCLKHSRIHAELKRSKLFQLRRHVRDMREARAIPATQIKAEEEKMALAKKALQSLQSFPRGMECIDPLRLGYLLSSYFLCISYCSLVISCAKWEASLYLQDS